ncbi:XRE family transcriptional regulator [Dietzia maris]|uniref:XRE family transcriptional regulator n=2 Tax=Dietzia maris TaxID=37915 RepID=UPI0037C56FCD
MTPSSLDDILAKRPVQRSAVERHKRRMLAEVRAYRLKELRQARELTQEDVAHKLHVGQNRVSDIERGELDRVKLDTLRRYVEAVGGTLHVEVELEDHRYEIA